MTASEPRVWIAAHRRGQGDVGEGARVVEVQGVGGVGVEVAPGEPGRVAQVAAGRGAEAVGGQGELGGAQLHVVEPARLRVEGVGECGHQRPRRVVRRRPGVEEPRLPQLVEGPGPVVRGVGLGGQRERRDDPADQVGADQVAGRGGREDGAVGDVAVQVGVVVVVGLRQPPEVVVAGERAGAVAGADPHLEVERLALAVPHLPEPVQPVARLGGQRLRCPVAEQTGAREQQDVVVRRGVGELQVVAGVEPAAGHVDPGPRRGCRARSVIRSEPGAMCGQR